MKLLDRIAKHPKKLTQNETLLVNYIMSCYPHGILDSATDIAKKIGISPSTVVRFFSKLGYESFPHVQREIRLEISSKLASPTQRAHLTTTADTTPEVILDNVFTFDKDNLNATRDANNVKDFQHIVDMLTQADLGKIYLVGAKNSYPVVHYLYTHLNMCMPNVCLLGNGGAILADELLWVKPDDVLLAISIRRYVKSVTQTAHHFRRIGARVSCITDSPLAPISGLADHRLIVQTASPSPFDSYTAAFSLCNAIITGVALIRKKETEKCLQQGEKLWKQFDVFIDHK